MKIVKCILWACWGVLVITLMGGAIMLLWNLLIPQLFGLSLISFWQALGLFALARLLFGGFGGHRMMGGMRGRHKNLIRDKWMRMSPQQREEFIHKRRSFGFGDPFGPDPFRYPDTRMTENCKESPKDDE